MKIKFILLLVNLFVGLKATSQNTLTGNWIGGLDNGNEWLDITIQFSEKNKLPFGLIDIASNGISNQELKNITVNESKIHFEWERNIGIAFFDGEFADGGLKGIYKRGNITSTFLLVRKATISLQVLDTYTGSYEVEPGRYISIGLFGNDDPGIRYEDSKTRRSGILYAVSVDKLIAGPAYSIPLPITFSISLIKKNGKITAIEYNENGKRYIGRKVAMHKQEELKYKIGKAEITGILYTPIENKKHAAIIIVRPGYSFVKRQGELVPFFLRQGLAVFTLTGKEIDGKPQNYNNSTFDERAADIIGGLNVIKAKPGIDPERIGLFDSSLSSWVAPIAANISKEVSFMILQVISALPVAENILYEIESDLKEQNILSPGTFSEEDINRAIDIRRHLNFSILNNKNWDTLKKEIEISKDKSWFAYTRSGWISNVTLPPDEKTVKELRASISYDPLPTLEKITIPVLTINGGFDNNVETNKTIPVLLNAFKKAQNKNATVVIIPYANHGLQEIEKGINSEYYKLKRSAFGYKNIIEDWIKRNITINKKH